MSPRSSGKRKMFLQDLVRDKEEVLGKDEVKEVVPTVPLVAQEEMTVVSSVATAVKSLDTSPLNVRINKEEKSDFDFPPGLDPRLSMPSELFKLLNFTAYEDFLGESFSDYDINTIVLNSNTEDNRHVSYLRDIQAQLLFSKFREARSIHSPEAIYFYKNILKCSHFVETVLCEGYMPG